MASMSASATSSVSHHLRSLYRSILRELPARPRAAPSPLQRSLRERIANPAPHNTVPPDGDSPQTKRALRQAQQYLHYVRAQRMYATLLERYNPGMDMDEQERVRLSARRVGMNMPEMYDKSGQEGGEGGSH